MPLEENDSASVNNMDKSAVYVGWNEGGRERKPL